MAMQVGVSVGLLGQDLFQVVLDVTVLTMIMTPLLFAIGPRSADAISRIPLVRLWKGGSNAAHLVPPHAYSRHILIIGFGVTGRNIARTARLSDLQYAIVEVNAAIVHQASASGEPIHYGDATQELILRHLNADKAAAIVVVINDPAGARRIVELSRRLAPDAYILVRSRYLREVELLLGLGADEVIADEMEVSIEVFSRILARMLAPREDIKRLIGEVRGSWRRMARSFAKEATSVPDLRVNVPELATHTLRLTENSPLVGRAIAKSRLRTDHGVTVLAITRRRQVLGNPPGDTMFHPGDILFVIDPADWDPASVA
nr:potassium channel protein [Deltaproteobacteria bacterium]